MDYCTQQCSAVYAGPPDAQLCDCVGHTEKPGQYTDRSHGVKTVPHMDFYFINTPHV